jgi:prepilin-type N-terminal cleavage/methylation domain-containing protein
MIPKNQNGFTLIELMIVVAIITILSVAAIMNYTNTARQSEEGVTKGNLAIIRSAIAIYYTDNDGNYPTDNLASITNSAHYLQAIPIAHVAPYHGELASVTAETTPSDTGGWSFNNAPTDTGWGSIHVGCLHQDAKGAIWTSY